MLSKLAQKMRIAEQKYKDATRAFCIKHAGRIATGEVCYQKEKVSGRIVGFRDTTIFIETNEKFDHIPDVLPEIPWYYKYDGSLWVVGGANCVHYCEADTVGLTECLSEII